MSSKIVIISSRNRKITANSAERDPVSLPNRVCLFVYHSSFAAAGWRVYLFLRCYGVIMFWVLNREFCEVHGNETPTSRLFALLRGWKSFNPFFLVFHHNNNRNPAILRARNVNAKITSRFLFLCFVVQAPSQIEASSVECLGRSALEM